MAEETLFHGLRIGDDWISRRDMTLDQADALIQQRMLGANREHSYWLEADGDHLAATFFERNQPGSRDYPGTNGFAKDGIWGTLRGAHSGKRKEYPNR